MACGECGVGWATVASGTLGERVAQSSVRVAMRAWSCSVVAEKVIVAVGSGAG